MIAVRRFIRAIGEVDPLTLSVISIALSSFALGMSIAKLVLK